MRRQNARSASPLDAMRDARPGSTVGPMRSGSVTGPPIARWLRGSAVSALGWCRERFVAAVRPGEAAPDGGGAPWRARLSARVGDVWWVGSSEPITLRLPRGVTVLVLGGVVGIIVMAFLAGRRTGPAHALALASPPADAAAVTGRVDPRPSHLSGLALEDVPGGAEWPGSGQGPSASEAQPPTAERLQARFDAGLDPRVDGLNYLVYITATRRECLRLADFLGERGIDAVVMASSRSVKAGDADGRMVELPLYWVVDVGRGFTREAYLRGDHAAFRDERMELGRAWRVHNGGRGSDLSDMQFYAYRASPSAR